MPDIKDDLTQLSKLQGEVKLLEDQLAKLKVRRQDINSNVRADGVKGSMPDFPYVLHNILVKGLSDMELGEKVSIRTDIQHIKKQLDRKREACVKEYVRLNSFILNVNDSEMRQILTLRYIYDAEWQDIADHLGGKATEDSVRVAHDRFLKKI